MTYSIGSDHMPGTSKLIEETGELLQVLGKIMGLGHMGTHWDGTELEDRVIEELGDVLGAIRFWGMQNLPGVERTNAIFARAELKYDQFMKWHTEQQRNPTE